ncbi:MAG TPA: hypothetical protein VIN08_25325 [Ohtaekwangia sp.]|uniref:hypothetical protein n=1 Tax=Ohtaekwangia sp. TaxID=2066019 RepID=UPI002F95CB2D
MNNLYTDYARVLHNEDLQCLEVTFIGFITLDELKKIVEYEFEMFTHYALKKCIVNLREITVYPVGGQEYIKTVWFPWVVKHGLQVLAFVVPDDVFTKMSIQAAHASGMQLMMTKYFQNSLDAQHWVKSR